MTTTTGTPGQSPQPPPWFAMPITTSRRRRPQQQVRSAPALHLIPRSCRGADQQLPGGWGSSPWSTIAWSGNCATFRIAEEIGLKTHTWTEITGNGYASGHDPQGDWLYGMEVCVDPDYRGHRMGQRLYNERKALCPSHSVWKGDSFARSVAVVVGAGESSAIPLFEQVTQKRLA